MVAYIWNQWLKMSSMSNARNPKYQRGLSIPKMARSPAVDSLLSAQTDPLPQPNVLQITQAEHHQKQQSLSIVWAACQGFSPI